MFDYIIVWGVLALLAIILIALFLRYFPILLWISARAFGGKNIPWQLFLMRIRNVPLN